MLTINRFGLKKRNLRKHKKPVKQFFEGLNKMELDTEVSLKWQKRLLCNKEELFTFLDFDGIPWNNNNAEAAIKAVAIYRRENDGFPTKRGIQDYLTLLSIHQTCKYRNVKFFDFLQKGETGIDAICQ